MRRLVEWGWHAMPWLYTSAYKKHTSLWLYFNQQLSFLPLVKLEFSSFLYRASIWNFLWKRTEKTWLLWSPQSPCRCYYNLFICNWVIPPFFSHLSYLMPVVSCQYINGNTRARLVSNIRYNKFCFTYEVFRHI